jgi:hypothetical protein
MGDVAAAVVVAVIVVKIARGSIMDPRDTYISTVPLYFLASFYGVRRLDQAL